MLLIRNLSQVATPVGTRGARGRSMRDLHVFENAVILIDENQFAFVGRESDMPAELRTRIDEDIDARGATALPGFVDSHTHLPFAGYRESEFNRRLQGETYEQITASGGGIVSTVRSTRAAPEEQLVANVLRRAKAMALHGTTTAEAKSGYGLDKECELRQLRAIRAAGDRHRRNHLLAQLIGELRQAVLRQGTDIRGRIDLIEQGSDRPVGHRLTLAGRGARVKPRL